MSVSALLLPDSKPRQALDLALRKGKVLLSFAALAELYEVLSRKQFRRYVDEENIRSFLAALTREAQWIDVDVRITACRDSKDDKFLELAVSGRAEPTRFARRNASRADRPLAPGATGTNGRDIRRWAAAARWSRRSGKGGALPGGPDSPLASCLNDQIDQLRKHDRT